MEAVSKSARPGSTIAKLKYQNNLLEAQIQKS